jgi:hypothetical protein
MPPKATTLYLKIAQTTTEADAEDLRRIRRLQDDLIKEGEFTSIGKLLLEEEVIDAQQHQQILAQHAYNNFRQADRLLAEWLLEEDITTREFVDEVDRQSRKAMSRGRPRIPRLATRLLAEEDMETSRVLFMQHLVMVPLQEMTRYFENYIEEGEEENIVYGRIAYQNQVLTRDRLFQALLEFGRTGAEGSFFDFLLETDRLSEYEEAMVLGVRAGFG